MLTSVLLGLYTDESPGLKVDPVVVLVLSLVFIFSVVALHSTSTVPRRLAFTSIAARLLTTYSHLQDYAQVLQLNMLDEQGGERVDRICGEEITRTGD